MTLGVILEKSGVNRNFNPSIALGIMRELMPNIMSNINSAGIIIFDIFSKKENNSPHDRAPIAGAKLCKMAVECFGI